MDCPKALVPGRWLDEWITPAKLLGVSLVELPGISQGEQY
jgi:hypothetical protein